MPYFAPHRVARKRILAALTAGIGDRFLSGVAVLTLLGAGEACAGDPLSGAATQPERDVGPRVSLTAPAFGSITQRAYTLSDPLLAVPGPYALGELPETKVYSSKDFRPRGRSMFDSDPRVAPAEALTADKDLGHRLKEYKSRDHIRVLTLWETGASAVSIQTDRKGDPSLQWTSRLMNRGGATQGLLDRLFPVSVFGGTTHITRSASSQPSRVSGALSALHFGSSPPPP
jgi:hypothetical protein